VSGPLAQSVEQKTFNLLVDGSNPSRPTKYTSWNIRRRPENPVASRVPALCPKGAGGDLHLLLRPDGARWWRWDYRRPVTGKRNTLSLGTYPDTGLADARTKHAEARRLLAAGIDPGGQREAERVTTVERTANTFGAVAAELLAQRAKTLAPVSVVRERRLLESDQSRGLRACAGFWCSPGTGQLQDL
jgi:hypothetical protein